MKASVIQRAIEIALRNRRSSADTNDPNIFHVDDDRQIYIEATRPGRMSEEDVSLMGSIGWEWDKRSAMWRYTEGTE